jgi:TolA-binding protein
MLICTFSCAYFNTFYNAEQYFKKAEKIRLEKAGESIPVSAIDDYSKVIEKSKRVIDEFPESNYRKDAILLIGKSHFYRQEFRLAEAIFQQFDDEFGSEFPFESSFWKAMVKWRQGKSQAALEDLNEIIDLQLISDQKSIVYLSIAEIQLELNSDSAALDNLLKGAELTTDTEQRGQIYYRIALLAFNKEDYDLALQANKNLIRYTTSKKRIEEAKLQIVRIHRLLGNWDIVMSEIKTILIDDRFDRIHGSLELELVQLYQMKGDHTLAKNRLESIIAEYPRTETSAEAYYMLGEIAINENWDLDDAEKQYSQVTREFRKSQYTPTANLRVKQIKSYNDSKSSITELSKEILTEVNNDTTNSDSIFIVKSNNVDSQVNYESLANHYYNLAELEAFHFNRPSDAIINFLMIVDSLPRTSQYSKSLFTSSYIAHQQDDTTLAILLRDSLLSQFPRSEYAEFLRMRYDMPDIDGSSNQLFRKGEIEWQNKPIDALGIFRTILQQDRESDVSARSAMYLAVKYDRFFSIADSALFYYDWLQKYKPESEQALATANRYHELKNTVSILKEVDSLKASEVIDTSSSFNNTATIDSTKNKVDN